MRIKLALLLVTVALVSGAVGYFIGTRPRTPPTPTSDSASEAAAASSAPMDVALDGVPREGVGFASLKVSRVWDHEAIRPLRDLMLTDAAQKRSTVEYGFPMAELDRLTGFWTWIPEVNGRLDGPTLHYVLATTRTPYDRQALRKRNAAEYRRAYNGGWRGPIVIDRTTVFLDNFGTGPRLNLPSSVERLVRHETVGPLSPALDDAKKHAFTVGFNGSRLGEVAKLAGLDAASLDGIKAAKTISICADLEDALVIQVKVTFADKAAAEAAKSALASLLAAWTAQLDTEHNHAIAHGQGSDPEVLVSVWAASVLRQLRVEVVDEALVATARVPFDGSFRSAVAGLPRLLDWDMEYRGAENNLKELGVAFHAAHDSQGRFPGPDVVDFGDRIPWSWRVQILPFVEQNALYSKLQFNLPWNDPVNLKVLEAAEMPKVFEHPGRPAPQGHTYFRVFAFPKGSKGVLAPIFHEGANNTRITDIADGTSNTILVVEAREAVPWYKPDFLPYDGMLPLPPLGSPTSRKFLAVMADGSVRSFPQSTPEATLRAYITRSGGEVIDTKNR